ncbi:MAG: type II secretion system GspH family protein, partial [Rickettsiales bacterium]|nr:type II secretion system GspH family protein [Rickettsiales bacterium]
MKNGFSLLELSIVLVIIGLLASGVMVGQSLVRGAELRSITTDAQKYMSARNSFRLKYNAVPGDFRESTRFWGRQVNVASCGTNSGAAVSTNGTCDGNGDGIIIAGSTGAGLSGEVFQFWRHLAQAGMVEGNFTGLAGPSSTAHHQTGINTPESKIASVGWGGGFIDNSDGAAPATFRRNYSNSF